MSTIKPKRIHLLGSGRHEEGNAAQADIKPGMLLELNAAGNIIKHNQNGGWAEKAIALEDALQGGTIDTVYTNGAPVTYVLAAPGDVCYVLLAAGEDVTADEYLASAGTGLFKVASGTNQRLCRAIESVDNNDSAAVPVRIKVRFL